MKKLSVFALAALAVIAIVAFSPKSTAKGMDDLPCITQPTAFKMTNRGVYSNATDIVKFLVNPVCNAVEYRWTLSSGPVWSTDTTNWLVLGPADLACGASNVTLEVRRSNGTWTPGVTQNLQVNCPLQ